MQLMSGLGSVERYAGLSFFNLDIELLLEGMAGVLRCETYRFHVERGHGDTYHTNVSNC